MSILHMNQESYRRHTAAADRPVLVEFWAPWCSYCRRLAPALEELSQQVKVVKVDVDENPQLAMAFQVESIPTVISFRDGRAVKKSVGVVPKESLLALLQ